LSANSFQYQANCVAEHGKDVSSTSHPKFLSSLITSGDILQRVEFTKTAS